MRSVPTTDNGNMMLHARSRSIDEEVAVDVSKNVITAASSQEGEFVTSTTTDAPSALGKPSPGDGVDTRIR